MCCVYVCASACVCAGTCACACEGVYVWVCVCLCVCVCVCGLVGGSVDVSERAFVSLIAIINKNYSLPYSQLLEEA